MQLLSLTSMTKLINKVLSCYLCYSNDPDTIISCLTKQLYNSNWKIKLSSLNLISSIFKDSLSTVSDSYVKNLTNALAYLSSDSSSLVSSAATKLLETLKPKVASEDAVFAFKSNIPYGNSASRTIIAPSSTILESSTNGLVFNFIEPSLFVEIEDESNWRGRVLAIQRVESTFEMLEDYEKVFPFMALFLRFIVKLINDKNFKICESSLLISLKIIEIPNVSLHCNLAALVGPCIHKLGDNKISIRMASYKVLKNLLLKLRPNAIIPYFSQSLENPNWHVREELVALIVTSMLLDLEYEYFDLIEPLAKLLDDPKPKIRNVAIEALAVLETKHDIMPSLGSLIDEYSLALLAARLDNKTLPKITENYIEYPKLSKNLTPMTTSYTMTQTDEVHTARETSPIETKYIQRPITELKEVSAVSKSYNSLPLKSEKYENKPEDTYYLTSQDLLPVKNPHETLQRLMNRTEDWEQQFQSINMLRRLVKHHPEVFFSKVTLHNITIDVVKFADSLRSSLSKNSLILIEEMCCTLRKSMDAEISEIIKILLKKTMDTNVFISSQAKKTMEKMFECLSENKILPYVLFYAQNAKKGLIKAEIAWCFELIFKKAKGNAGKLRDIEKTLQILSELIIDGTIEVRLAARQALNELYKSINNQSEFEILLIRSLKDSQHQRILKLLDKKASQPITIKSLSDIRIKKPLFSIRGHLPKLVPQKSTEKFSDLNTKMQDLDWKVRYESLSLLLELSKGNDIDSSQIDQILNIIYTGLLDSHPKVQIKTTIILKQLIKALKKNLNPHLFMITGSLNKILSSSNRNLRESAGDVVMSLAAHCNASILLMCFEEHIKNCRSRAKVWYLKGINKLAEFISDENFQSFVEIVCDCADQTKPDVRAQAAELLKNLYKLKPDKVVDYVPRNKIDAVNDILGL
jgi:CLASP N terminal